MAFFQFRLDESKQVLNTPDLLQHAEAGVQRLSKVDTYLGRDLTLSNYLLFTSPYLFIDSPAKTER